MKFHGEDLKLCFIYPKGDKRRKYSLPVARSRHIDGSIVLARQRQLFVVCINIVLLTIDCRCVS